MRGLRTPGRYLLGLQVLAMLSGTFLLVYLFRKKVTTSTKAQEVYNLLIAAGLNPTIAKFATAQAAFETGGFTSNIFLKNNNLFGMKYAGQSNATGEQFGHATYKTINNSVLDWVIWYAKRRISILSLPLVINSIPTFVRFLKSNNYFEADEQLYLKGVSKYYNDIFDENVQSI